MDKNETTPGRDPGVIPTERIEDYPYYIKSIDDCQYVSYRCDTNKIFARDWR